jgi:hypothetical protein
MGSVRPSSDIEGALDPLQARQHSDRSQAVASRLINWLLTCERTRSANIHRVGGTLGRRRR